MKNKLTIISLLLIILNLATAPTLANDECYHIERYGSWVRVDNTYHKMIWTCEECGKKLTDEEAYDEPSDVEIERHEWSDWEVTKEATPYAKGSKNRYCLVCNAKQNNEIPKKELTVNQKKAIKTVKAYLKSAKKYDYKKMNKCFKKTKSKYGYPTTKYYKTLFKKHNKKIKWDILDATGKGNTIKVKVKVTRPAFYKPFYNAFYKTLEWYMSHPNASQNSFNKYYNKKVKSYIKKYMNKTDTNTETFTVIKTKKGWKIKSKSKAITDIACGFINKALDDAGNDFINDYS